MGYAAWASWSAERLEGGQEEREAVTNPLLALVFAGAFYLLFYLRTQYVRLRALEKRLNRLEKRNLRHHPLLCKECGERIRNPRFDENGNLICEACLVDDADACLFDMDEASRRGMSREEEGRKEGREWMTN